MKNGLLIWNVLLTLIVGYLLYSHFSHRAARGEHEPPEFAGGPKDSLRYHKPVRIAYFDMDSIQSNWSLAKDVQAGWSKNEDSIKNVMSKLTQNYQSQVNFYQNKAQTAPGMSPQEQEDAQQHLSNMMDAMRNTKMEMDQKYQERAFNDNRSLKTEIENFIRNYNADKGYTYIFANESGLFYYLDSTFNITADVVKGLNMSYKKKD